MYSKKWILGFDGGRRDSHATPAAHPGPGPGGRVPAQRGGRGRPAAARAAQAQAQQEQDRLLLEVWLEETSMKVTYLHVLTLVDCHCTLFNAYYDVGSHFRDYELSAGGPPSTEILVALF